jgi:hypothetical protein
LKIICAWCKAEIKNGGFDKDTEHPISHGICPDCTEKMLSKYAMPLTSYLDKFEKPVFLINSEGRILSANNAAYEALNKKPSRVNDHLGGDAFECDYAKLPGGCGNTIHCKTCTVRLTVTDTMLTGKSHTDILAYGDFHFVTGRMNLKFIISTEKIGDKVLLRIDKIL